MCEIGEQEKAIGQSAGARAGIIKLLNWRNRFLFPAPAHCSCCLPSAFCLLDLRFNQAVIPVLPLIKHSKAAGVGIAKY
jgi:hypothetical protein